ncbi:acyltransferase [Paenibacillus swuensis]|nr:acyltransferase [Paenibacillus swuensis]
MSTSKARIDELVLLRAMAFLAIVLQHCIGEFIYRPETLPHDGIMLGMLFHFTRFGTPTFIFISGLLFFYNYYHSLNYGSFIRKRVMDIYVPFVIWTIVYFTLSQGVLWFIQGESWLLFLKELFIPSNAYHLWFIVMIFQFYLLFPMFRGIVRFGQRLWERHGAEMAGKAALNTMIVFGVLFLGYLYLSYDIFPRIHASTDQGWLQWLIEHRMLYFISHAFYFVSGAVIALYLSQWRDLVRKSSAWNPFIFALLYVWMGYRLLSHSTDTMNLYVSTYLKPSTFLLIVSQMLIMYGMSLKLAETRSLLQRLFRWIGTYSFGGFLAHPLAIWALAPLTRPDRWVGNHLGVTALFYIGVLALSLGLSYGVSKLPFGSWIMGPTGAKRALRPAKGTSQPVQDAPVTLS